MTEQIVTEIVISAEGAQRAFEGLARGASAYADATKRAGASTDELETRVEASARVTRQASAELDRMLRSLDPVYNATRSLSQEDDRLTKALGTLYSQLQRGDVTMEQAAARATALSEAQARVRMTSEQLSAGTVNASQALETLGGRAVTAGAGLRVSATNMAILQSGAINTFQTIAAGGSVMQTLITQATQTAPAFIGAGNAMGTMRAAMVAFAPEIAAAAIALGAIGAAFSLVSKVMGDAEAAQLKLNEAVAAGGKAYDAMNEPMKKRREALEQEVGVARTLLEIEEKRAHLVGTDMASANAQGILGRGGTSDLALSGMDLTGLVQGMAMNADAVRAARFALEIFKERTGVYPNDRAGSDTNITRLDTLSRDTERNQVSLDIQRQAAGIGNLQERERFVALKRAEAEILDKALVGMEKEAVLRQALDGITIKQAQALLDYTNNLTLQVDAANRSADAAGKGEAAQRAASAANTEAAAASQSAAMGALAHAAAVEKEAATVRAIHTEQTTAIADQTRNSDALAAAYAQGQGAVDTVTIAEKARLLTLRETTAASANYNEVLNEYIRILTGAANANRNTGLAADVATQQRQLDMLEKEAGFIGQTAQQRSISVAQLRAENELVARNVDLSSDQARVYIANAGHIAEMTSSYQEFDRVTTKVTDDLTSAFVNIFDSGKSMFAGLRDYAIQMFKEIAANAIIRPIIAPIVAGALGSFGFSGGASASTGGGAMGGGGFDLIGGLSNGFSTLSSIFSGGSMFGAGTTAWLNGLGASSGIFGGGVTSAMGPTLPSSGLLGSTGLSSVLSGGGLGYGIGSLWGAAGLGNSTGSSIGGTIGGIAGSFLPIPGGTIIGSVIGSAIGGLFGPGKTVGPNGSGGVTVDDMGNITSTRQSSDNGGSSSGPLKLTQGIASALRTITSNTDVRLADGLSFGTSAFGTGLYGNISVNGDYLDGFGKGAIGGIRHGGQSIGKDPNAAAGTIIKAILEDAATGLTDTMRTVLRSSVVKTAEDVGKALDFAKLFDSLGQAAEPVDNAAEAIKALNAQFDALADEAEKYGLSQDTVEAARQTARDKLTSDFNQSITDQITGALDPLGSAWTALRRAQEQRLREATTLGADLVEVERLAGMEREALLKAQTQGLTDWLTRQAFGGSSSLSPIDRLTLAQSEFGSTLASAQGGDASAIGNITGYADNLLSAAANAFGTSTSEYTTIEQFVRSSIGNLSGQISADGMAAMGAASATPVVNAIAAQTTQQSEDTASLKAEIVTMRLQLQQLGEFLRQAAA